MKPHNLGKFIKIASMCTLLTMAMACGKKNQVKGGAPGVGTTIMGIPNLPADSAAQIQQIIASYPCQQGARMPEIQLSTTGAAPGGNTTLINGPYNGGAIGGPAVRAFVGKSSFNDIMVVTKIANGNQVLGYNVTLSFCQYSPYVMPGRPLSGFTTPQGIIIDEVTTAGLGRVVLAPTSMIAAAYQNYPQGVLQTTFYYIGSGTTGGYTGGGYYGL